MSGKGSEVSITKSYPVWVGFLEESIDENFLRQKFKKFGPIRNIQINKEKGKQKTGNTFLLAFYILQYPIEISYLFSR